MTDLIGENKLLKDLVGTLENENESKNRERGVLYKQIQRLRFENDELQRKLKGITTIENQNTRLKIRLRELQSKTTLKTERTVVDGSRKREIELEGRILELQRKVKNQDQEYKSQLQLGERKFNNKLNEKEIKIREVESKLSTSLANAKSLQNSKSDYFKLQVKIKEKDDKIKLLQASKIQILNQIKTLEVELAEKKNALTTLREKEKEIAKFNETLQNKQSEIRRLDIMVSNLKQSLLKSEQKLRSREIEKSHVEVENSRMKELMEEDGHMHEQQMNRTKMKYQLEIKRLNATIEKLQYERQMEHQNIESGEMMQMRKENEYLNRLISTLKEDNKNIKQTAHYQKQRLQQLEFNQNSSLSHHSSEQRDLKEMVFQLKRQLSQMKSSYVKMHLENEKMHSAINQHIVHKDLAPFQSSPRSQVYQSEMNMGEHFMGRRSKLTPSRMSENCEWGMKSEKYEGGKRMEMPSNFTLGKNGGVGKQKSENQSVNREKWEALQRKINMLREQNDELKKTLFD